MEYFIAFLIILALLIIMIKQVISIYNHLVMLNRNVEKNFANIDVLLKQRADEIPNLMIIVKQSMVYEQDLLTQITQLRNSYLTHTQIEKKIATNNELTSSLKTLFALSENYPQLRANHSLLELQQRVSQLENKIADRREFYNESVNLYNIGIQEFPELILAKLLRYPLKSMLVITEKEKSFDGIKF